MPPSPPLPRGGRLGAAADGPGRRGGDAFGPEAGAGALAGRRRWGGGILAFLEGTRLGLECLLALPPETLRALALSLRADCSPRELGPAAVELAAWPEDLRALAAPGPLYELGMRVPIYGQWQHARLHALSDLCEPAPRSISLGLELPRARRLGRRGVATAGIGSHSFRRGRAMEPLHGGSTAGKLLPRRCASGAWRLPGSIPPSRCASCPSPHR